MMLNSRGEWREDSVNSREKRVCFFFASLFKVIDS